MGQYWILVNLDKCEVHPYPGGGIKLGEGFWRNSNYKSALISLLVDGSRIGLPYNFHGLDDIKKDLTKNFELFHSRYVPRFTDGLSGSE